MVSNQFTYYVYGSTIARIDKGTGCLNVKSHENNQWNEVNEPSIWKRIQEEGDKVSAEEAEKMYKHFHASIKKK